ncbi:MAG: Maf family nucleotide pyrophosphatase [Rikenellaceae bacterium]
MLIQNRIAEGGYKLILASQSPRRRELLSAAGFEFRTINIDVEERYPQTLAPECVAEYLSKLKSAGYTDQLQEREILITADTVVLLGGKVLGKPTCLEAAKEMLAELSGAEHIVVTGVTMRSTVGEVTFSATTKVHFAQLSDGQIEHYVDNYKPLDKAGSYGIQEWIGYVGIERIDGSFYNVMGLPIQRVCRELEGMLGA